ncbi:MAG: hypothetical protein IKG27_00650 [Bacilli bacterium]|nr:hypothetical protein [Bacilli bacterium]
MNKITFKELTDVCKIIKTQNISDEDEFDYLRVIGLSAKYEEKAKNPLYFLSYTKEEEKGHGWYINNFDLRPYFNNICSEHPKYTYIIEPSMEKDANKDTKYIIVENINTTIDKIYEYILNRSKAKVIAFTGSVGKTTAVGLLEKALKEKYNVLRVYSKRITPINLKANIINFLEKNIDYVILENSLYYHDHVKILSTLLKPEIVSMLNIKSSHLGVEKLNSVDDICIYKADIMRNAKYAYLNNNDSYLKNITLDKGIVKYKGKELFENKNLQINYVNNKELQVVDNCFLINNNIKVEPFILSALAGIQYLTCYKIAKKLGLTNEQIKKGLENYMPVENRLNKKKAFGKEIIFDGDVTTYERMNEIADTLYSKKYLVLRKVGSAENTFRIKNIVDFFSKFEKVFIFDDIDYLDELKKEKNVVIVSSNDFIKDLDGQIIYHYSGYYRVWDEFKEENLNIYDREKYKIIKEND